MTLSAQQRQQLRKMLGRSICYHGMDGRVIEFLEQEQALVIHLPGGVPSLQEGQYGEPGRQVTSTISLPIVDPKQPGRLNPELAELQLEL